MRGGTISSCDDTCSRCVNLPEKKEERSINITFEKKLELLCNGRRKKGMERNEKKKILKWKVTDVESLERILNTEVINKKMVDGRDKQT